ncbi:MAG: PAS domain-containing sensor histidine kinase, partial [Rhodoferax sp.]
EAEAVRLRRRAEQRLRGSFKPVFVDLPSAAQAKRMLHELQVQKLELEMQNEDLLAARNAAEQVAARYTELYEFSPVAYATLTASGKIIDANLAFARLLNGERNALVGKRLGAFVEAADRHRLSQVLQSVCADRYAGPCEFQLLPVRHQPCTVQMHVSRNADGDECRAVLTDVTERKSAEAALEELHRFSQQIVAEAQEGIVVYGADLCYRFWNPYMEKVTGRSAAEVLGRHPLEVFPTLQTTGLVAQIQAALRGHTPADIELGYPPTVADTGVRWTRNKTHPFRDGKVKIVGAIVTVNDITERQHAEAQMHAARELAECANDAKSRFLAAASHDLRQPLTAMSLYLEVLKSRQGIADERLLSNMGNCVASLSDLLTDLLDISKLDSGAMQPEPRNFSVSDMLARLLAIHAPLAKACGLDLRWRPRALVAHTDVVLMSRIVGNLLANAIRYTERGGVLVGCRQRHGKTWIEVWDTGIGIAPEQTQEIFIEYRQLKSVDASAMGSGLGLAIVARTAALLNLEIRVHSRPGRGSLFAVELPLS